jgi:HK97 family phage prohead protease
MRTADFSLKVKGLQDSGQFTGYASTYNGVDFMGDTICVGAFRQSIASQGAFGYPLLWNHDSGSPIGIARVSDSQAGLVVAGELVLADSVAQRAYALIKASAVRGLSIGFQDVKSEPQGNGGRLLKEIKLFEVSLCAIPADPRALVTSVKSATAVLASLRAGSLTPEDRAGLVRTLKLLLGKDASCECDCPQCLAGDCADCSNPDCEDSNCEGSMNDQAATLSALRSLAAELRS